MIETDIRSALRQGMRGSDRPEYKDPWDYFGEKAPIWAKSAWNGLAYLNSGTNIMVPGAPEGSIRTKTGVIIPEKLRDEEGSLLVKGTIPLSADGHEMAAIGGKGSGKTFTMGGLGMARKIQRWPGSRWLIAANTYSQAYGSAGVKLVEVANAMGLEFYHRTEMVLDGTKVYNVYVFPDYDVLVCILSFDNIKMIEGTEWDGAHFEEIQDCEREAVETAVSRVRRGRADGSITYAGMPDDVNHWMYSYFEENEIPLFEPPLKENEHNLPKNYMKRMRRYFGADFDRYVLGKRISLYRTPALRRFQWDVHVTSDDNPEVASLGYLSNYDRRSKLYITWDFNVNPLCVTAWQMKSVALEVEGEGRLSCPECNQDLVHSHLLGGHGCPEHGFVLHPNRAASGTVHKELLVQINEWEMFGGNTELMCDDILEDYANHLGGGLVIGDSTGSKTSTNTRDPGRTDWSIIAGKLGKIKGMVIRPGVVRTRKAAKSKRVRGEKKVTYTNPPVRDRVTVLDSYLFDRDGHPRMVFMPVSKYPSGGAAKSCAGARWTGEGKIDSKNDKLPPTERAVDRTHFFDGVGYLVYHITGGKSDAEGDSSPELSRAKLQRRARFAR